MFPTVVDLTLPNAADLAGLPLAHRVGLVAVNDHAARAGAGAVDGGVAASWTDPCHRPSVPSSWDSSDRPLPSSPAAFPCRSHCEIPGACPCAAASPVADDRHHLAAADGVDLLAVVGLVPDGHVAADGHLAAAVDFVVGPLAGRAAGAFLDRESLGTYQGCRRPLAA